MSKKLTKDEIMNRVNAYLANPLLVHPTCSIHEISLVYYERQDSFGFECLLACPLCDYKRTISTMMIQNSASQMMMATNISRGLASRPAIIKELTERLNSDEIVE